MAGFPPPPDPNLHKFFPQGVFLYLFVLVYFIERGVSQMSADHWYIGAPFIFMNETLRSLG